MTTYRYLPGWTVSRINSTPTELTAEGEYELEPGSCPRCQAFDQLTRYGWRISDFREAPVRGKRILIRAHRRRYQCLPCSLTFLQPLPDMQVGHRMTVRCRDYILNQSLLLPFTQIADVVGINEKVVRQVCTRDTKVTHPIDRLRIHALGRDSYSEAEG